MHVMLNIMIKDIKYTMLGKKVCQQERTLQDACIHFFFNNTEDHPRLMIRHVAAASRKVTHPGTVPGQARLTTEFQ